MQGEASTASMQVIRRECGAVEKKLKGRKKRKVADCKCRQTSRLQRERERERTSGMMMVPEAKTGSSRSRVMGGAPGS